MSARQNLQKNGYTPLETRELIMDVTKCGFTRANYGIEILLTTEMFIFSAPKRIKCAIIHVGLFI